jgi:hypothetical protein
MDRRTFVKTVPALAMMAGASSAFAEELKPIVLPKPELSAVLKLRPEQRVLFAQTVGCPVKS